MYKYTQAKYKQRPRISHVISPKVSGEHMLRGSKRFERPKV